MTERSRSLRLLDVLTGNALMLLPLAVFAALDRQPPDLFYRSVQEDEILEWATFWGFLGAAVIQVQLGARQWRATRRRPWFGAGVALFCSFVALEEISWGQRVVGFRPPAFFLEHNLQQELNVHDVVDDELRQAAFLGLLLAYGVALPLCGVVPALRRALERLAVVLPPLGLVPAFAASALVYVAHPFDFSGEVVECAIALGFLFAALAGTRRMGRASPAPRAAVWPATNAALFGLGALALLALAAANAWWSNARRAAQPERIEMARSELLALRDDFHGELRRADGQLPSTCGLHERLYAYKRKYRHEFLGRGEFAALRQRGLHDARAQYLLDPWNTPYWLRDRCGEGLRQVTLYSFGPNRRRDSGPWELAGDDVGVVLFPPAASGAAARAVGPTPPPAADGP